jgi:hypothetical protein
VLVLVLPQAFYFNQKAAVVAQEPSLLDLQDLSDHFLESADLERNPPHLGTSLDALSQGQLPQLCESEVFDPPVGGDL